MESDSVSGSQKVKLSIGKISAVKERILQTISNANHQQMTIEEETITNKRIIIPSFSTTSAIFSQHCVILKDLRKRIDALKFAY